MLNLHNFAAGAKYISEYTSYIMTVISSREFFEDDAYGRRVKMMMLGKGKVFKNSYQTQ